MTEKRKEPEIRFAGFTDVWEQRKLGELSSLITKGTTPLDKSGNGNINFVKIESIDSISGKITITSTISEEEHNGHLSRSQLQEGDVLFSIAGTLGRVTTLNKDMLPANTNQALAIIRLKNSCIDYITTYLKGKAVSEFVKKNPTVGAQPNLSLEQVGNMEIALPNSDEQEKIGQYFKSLDNLITLHQRKIDKLVIIKKSLLQKMFPNCGSNLPEIRFVEFTDEWMKFKLGDLFKYERPDNYIVKSEVYSDEFDTPVLTANKGFILGYTNEKSVYTRHSIIFDDFTLDCKYVDFPYMVKSSAIKILTVRDEKQNDLRFAFELLNSTKIEMMGHARHFIKVVQPTNVFAPGINEQEKISQLFSTLDNLIILHQRKLGKLKNIKISLLDKMFVSEV